MHLGIPIPEVQASHESVIPILDTTLASANAFNVKSEHLMFKRQQSLRPTPLNKDHPSQELLGHQFHDEIHYDALADLITGSPHTDSLPRSNRVGLYSKQTGFVTGDSLYTLPFSENSDLQSVFQQDFFWLSFSDPKVNEVQDIAHALSIHPLTAEDVVSQDSREKCELFPGYYFVVCQSFNPDDKQSGFLQPIKMCLIVFPKCIVTFTHTHTPLVSKVIRRIKKLEPFDITVTPDWILYALLENLVESFRNPIHVIEQKVDTIESEEFELHEKDHLAQLKEIVRARKQVTQMIRLINTKDDLINMILHRCFQEGGETKLYLQDIYDTVISLTQNLIIYESALGRAHSNCLAMISIAMTEASTRTGDVASRITVLASILVPLNIITGLWGMNVHVPGQNDDNLLWFFGIVGAMVVLTLLTAFFAKRMNAL